MALRRKKNASNSKKTETDNQEDRSTFSTCPSQSTTGSLGHPGETILRRSSRLVAFPGNVEDNGSDNSCNSAVDLQPPSISGGARNNRNQRFVNMASLIMGRWHLVALGSLLLLFILLTGNWYIWPKATYSEHYDKNCYKEYSKALVQLQRQFKYQSSWFWWTLRTVAWNVMFDSNQRLPGSVLVVIPHGMEDVGYSIALDVTDTFNRLHGQTKFKHITCSGMDTGMSMTEYHTQLNLDVDTVRATGQKAVLVDHLEKAPPASVTLMNYFFDKVGETSCNKLIVFTVYLSPQKCNPQEVTAFLAKAWNSKGKELVALRTRLTNNMVFISPNNEHC